MRNRVSQWFPTLSQMDPFEISSFDSPTILVQTIKLECTFHPETTRDRLTERKIGINISHCVMRTMHALVQVQWGICQHLLVLLRLRGQKGRRVKGNRRR